MDKPPLEVLALHLATERDARTVMDLHNTRRQLLKDESLPVAHLVMLKQRGNTFGWMVVLEKSGGGKT